MSDDAIYCLCGTEMWWQECDACGGEGLDGHDCGEDCCCCEDPDEPNVRCGVCSGSGGWWTCPNARDGEKHGRQAEVAP